MKKISKVLSLTVAASSLLLLSGCHGAKEAKSLAIPDKFDTSRSYEITFWAKNDTNKTQTDIYKKAISDFEALYPNIKVDLRLYTDYGKIYNDVITNIATDAKRLHHLSGSHRHLFKRRGNRRTARYSFFQ